jgi:hypothetical protein
LFWAEGVQRTSDKSRLLPEIRINSIATSLGQDEVNANELNVRMGAHVRHVLGRHPREGRPQDPPLDSILEEHARPN